MKRCRSIFIIFQGQAPDKLTKWLRSVEDPLGFRISVVYRIACSWDHVYIGQTGCTVMERTKKHKRCIKWKQSDKSALVVHCLMFSHPALSDDMRVVSQVGGFGDQVIVEAISLQMEPWMVNRDEGLKLKNVWLPFVGVLNHSVK